MPSLLNQPPKEAAIPKQIDPAIRAQQQYDKAVEDLGKAEDRLARAQETYDAAHFAHERAEAWVSYARKNPDLPAQPSTEAAPENSVSIPEGQILTGQLVIGNDTVS